MREYKTFVFLDVKKTGTTFIGTVLKKFSRERPVRTAAHAGMPEDCDRSKYYFISVRRPLDLYISLYSHGCQSKGQLAWRLNQRELDGLYDNTWSGFERWLWFVLDPDHANLLGDGYGPRASGRVSECVGFMSYRVLKLAVPGSSRILHDCDSRHAVDAIYEKHKLPKHAVRTESLRPDLKDLVTLKLPGRFRNVEAALRYIDTSEPLNVSRRVDRLEAGATLDKGLRHHLEEREWWVHQEFNY